MAMTSRQRAALTAGADYVAARTLRRELHEQWMHDAGARDTVSALQAGAVELEAAAIAALAEALRPEAPAALAPQPRAAPKR